MIFNEVLKKERDERGITEESAADALGISLDEYLEFESDQEHMAEEWATHLVNIAIELEVPSSRLLSSTGKYIDLKAGKCGEQIKYQRENNKKNKTKGDIANRLEIDLEEYNEIEGCKSPIEKFGPLFLAFADLVNIPVINILCPGAVPYKVRKREPA